MKVTIHAGGKVSKAKDCTVSAAVIDGLPGEDGGLVVSAAGRGASSRTTAIMFGLALGIGFALQRGATGVECLVPSKAVVRQVDGSQGERPSDYHQAYAGAWVIYWTRDRCPDGWSIEYVPPKLLDPRVAEAASKAMGESLAGMDSDASATAPASAVEVAR